MFKSRLGSRLGEEAKWRKLLTQLRIIESDEMGIAKLIVTGAAAAAALPASAPAGAQPTRPPDAHDRGPPRTDGIEQADGIIAPDHYAAPVANWRYRRVGVGERLPRAFYGHNYVVAHPVGFGVEPAGRGRRWVRYADDLLLVEMRSGRVMRAIPGGYRRRR